jgi:tRNA(adenine34) deaminase
MPIFNPHHETYMELALEEAELGRKEGEVPVGAVLLSASGEIVAKAHNQVIGLSDPTGHAEILALRAAAKKAMNYRLPDTVLYITIEPCIMCMGAILHARVGCIVFGAHDPKWGACGSLLDLSRDPRLNHKITVVSGVRETECREGIQGFFKNKRKDKKSSK